MKTETKIKKPIILTVADQEKFITRSLLMLNTYLGIYDDNINKKTNLKYLQDAVIAAANIASAGRDLIEQLENQE